MPYVDHIRTYSNDILEVKSILGVEAARKTMLNEIRLVLNFYGIYVNYRHLSTLVDNVCHTGKLMGFTRHGINRSGKGPILKSSYEETVDMLFQSALFAEVDYLKGVSENVAVGQMAPLGTGEFDVLVDMKKIELAQQTIDEDMNWMEEDNDNDELEHPSTPYGLLSPSYEQQLGIKTPQIGTPQ